MDLMAWTCIAIVAIIALFISKLFFEYKQKKTERICKTIDRGLDVLEKIGNNLRAYSAQNWKLTARDLDEIAESAKQNHLKRKKTGDIGSLSDESL